ncbi:MAG: hypothetical protein GX622_12610 [Bacteroidales bacterium]|nr:hypothetical protein [Bacteroidales bacterium]
MKAMKYMKVSILIALLVFFSCDDRGEEWVDDDPPVPCRMIIKKDACGTTDIGTNLEWLNTLILSSYNDQTEIYRGRIWVKNYNGVDYIVTDMPISTGYTGYHVFLCDGSETEIDNNSFFTSLSNSQLLWVSFCPEPGTTD